MQILVGKWNTKKERKKERNKRRKKEKKKEYRIKHQQHVKCLQYRCSEINTSTAIEAYDLQLPAAARNACHPH